MKSETPLSLVLGGIRTHNLLIFGLTTKSSCLGARQIDLIWRVRWIFAIAQALRMTDAQANFYIFVKSETPLSLVLGGIQTHNLLIFGLTTKPSFLPVKPVRLQADSNIFDNAIWGYAELSWWRSALSGCFVACTVKHCTL